MIPDMGRRGGVFAALIALAVSASGLLNDFVYDDVPIIRDNLRLHALANWWEIVSRPYWPPPFVEQLYRPASSLLLATEYAMGGGQPLVFRVVSMVLYAAGTAAMFRLASRFVSSRAAFAGAVLFGVHPVHVEAVALGVNQGELAVGLLSILIVTHYVVRRRSGGPSAWDWVIVGAGYGMACLFKENAFVLPAILIAAELTVLHDTPPNGGIAKLLPGYLGLCGIAVAVLVARVAALSGRVVGASTAVALQGLDLGGRLLTMLQVVPIWLRLLVWPHQLRADYDSSAISMASSVGLPEVTGVVLIVAAVTVVVLARRGAPVVSFGLAWCIIALLPVSNIVPTGIVLAERTLYLPSMGFLLAVAALGVLAARKSRWIKFNARRVVGVAWLVMALLGFVRSANRNSLWNSAHVVIARPMGAP